MGVRAFHRDEKEWDTAAERLADSVRVERCCRGQVFSDIPIGDVRSS